MDREAQDVAILKDTFAENEALLVTTRAALLGFPMSGEQRRQLSVFSNTALLDAFKRKIYPVIDREAGVGRLQDYWMGTETQILGKSVEEINQVIQYKAMCLEFIEKGLTYLANQKGEQPDITFNPKGYNDKYQVFLLARNQYIRTVETTLTFVKTIAGTKKETVEEAIKRIEIDSSK